MTTREKFMGVFLLLLFLLVLSTSYSKADQRTNEDNVATSLQNLTYISCLMGIKFSGQYVNMNKNQQEKAIFSCLEYSRK